MNESFLELPKEKQQRIINAGFEVFSRNEYKRASTDEIAILGNISKGLLFYYFHNKKSFYMFLFEKAIKLVTDSVINTNYVKITDFFELCEYAAKQKQELLNQAPYIMDFFIRAFYSQKEDVSEELNQKMLATVTTLYSDYFKHIDLLKFRDGIESKEILQMLTWMSDGYIHEIRRKGQPVDIDDYMNQYQRWSALLKQISYKEEYLK